MNGLQVGASYAKNCCVSDLEFIVVVLLCYPDWTVPGKYRMFGLAA